MPTWLWILVLVTIVNAPMAFVMWRWPLGRKG